MDGKPWASVFRYLLAAAALFVGSFSDLATAQQGLTQRLPPVSAEEQVSPEQAQAYVNEILDRRWAARQPSIQPNLDSLTANPMVVAPHSTHGGGSDRPPLSANGEDPHAACFATTDYPSAKTCAECHKQIYDEWRVSSHAYASISPMFHKFEQKITELSRGTVGYFCLRCHAPVATLANYPRHEPMIDAPDVFKEGVTCVACHRVKERYGRVNGERRIEPGTVHDPVFGSSSAPGLKEVLQNKNVFKVKSDSQDQGPGTPIHRQTIQFEQLSQSSFCASCHQVAVHPGIALEVVWAQYRASPACKAGVSCQDCHMGKKPGIASGYETAPAAIVNGKAVNPNRKHSNHAFFGPGYSVAHPGIYPQNVKAERWKPDTWLKFDYRAGWGTEKFEQALEEKKLSVQFPPEWANSDERTDAREILNVNLELLQKKDEMRRAVMENGMKIEGPFFTSAQQRGQNLDFNYIVHSINPGHNTPSGSLGAQPQMWVNVVLINPQGQRVWESGHVDANGDIADLHSLEVRAGRLPVDRQLVNFQTKFLITNVKGTDREMYLPVNVDVDPLPFLRPGTIPITVLNHPPLIRMEAHSIPPLGQKVAKYRVPGNCLQLPGKYRLSIRMRSRAEPIYFMRFCGATPDMEQAMNEKVLNLHPYSVEFDVN